MRHTEYEKRRRSLEKQYEEDLELIRTAHLAKLRALEMLWLASPAGEPPATAQPVPPVGGDPVRGEEREDTPPPSEPQSATETQEDGETQAAGETQGEAAGLVETQGSVGTQPPAATREILPRLPVSDLKQAIRDVLPQLPPVFERHELVKALGFTPPRSTLVRILQQMWWNDKELEIVEFSQGRRPTRYRKVAGSAT